MKRRQIIIYIIIGLIAFAGLAAFILKKYSTIFAEGSSWTHKTGPANSNQIIHNYNGTSYTYNITLSNVIIEYRGKQIYTNTKLALLSPTLHLQKLNQALDADRSVPSNRKHAFSIGLIVSSDYKTIYGAGIYVNKSADTNTGDARVGDGQVYLVFEGQRNRARSNNDNYQGFLMNMSDAQSYAFFQLKTMKDKFPSLYNYYINMIPNEYEYLKIPLSESEENPDADITIHPKAQEKCETYLPQKIKVGSEPEFIKKAIENFKEAYGLKNLNTTEVLGGKEKEQQFLDNLHAAFQIDPERPWRSSKQIQSYLTTTMNNLGQTVDQMYKDEEVLETTQQAGTSPLCYGGSALLAISGAGGAGLKAAGTVFRSRTLLAGVGRITKIGTAGAKGFVLGGVKGEIACTIPTYIIEKITQKISIRNWRDDYIKSVYTLYYVDSYLAYLECLADNHDVSPEAKEIINKEIKQVESSIRALTGIMEEGAEKASTESGLFGTLYKGFTNIMTNLMKRAMIFVWGLVSSAPL